MVTREEVFNMLFLKHKNNIDTCYEAVAYNRTFTEVNYKIWNMGYAKAYPQIDELFSAKLKNLDDWMYYKSLEIPPNISLRNVEWKPLKELL